jgi:phosphoglucomutase
LNKLLLNYKFIRKYLFILLQIFSISSKITEYKIVQNLECDVSKVGEHTFNIGDRELKVQIIDSVEDYLHLMREIFDFEALKKFFGSGVRITVNALNGGKI